MESTTTPFSKSPLSRLLQAHVQKHVDNGTLDDVAQAVGYGKPDMLRRFASGEVRVPIDRAVPLAKALGISPSLIIGLGVVDHWPHLADVIACLTVGSDTPQTIAVAEQTDAPADDQFARDEAPVSSPTNPLPIAADMSCGWVNMNFKVAPSFHLRFCKEALRRDIFLKNLLELAFEHLLESSNPGRVRGG